MQIFSYMRRDSAYKEVLKTLFLLVLIVSYGALTDMLYYLPPLLGVAFVLFCNFMEKGKIHYLFPIVIFLLFFEATKGFLWLSSIIFFLISYYLVVPKVKQVLGCEKCLIPLFVFYAYFGFYLFSNAMGLLLGVGTPSISTLLLYFAIVESFFLVILL